MRSSLVEIEELTRQHRARENRPQNKCVVQAPGRHAAAPRQAGRRRPPRPATSGTGASAAQRRVQAPERLFVYNGRGETCLAHDQVSSFFTRRDLQVESEDAESRIEIYRSVLDAPV